MTVGKKTDWRKKSGAKQSKGVKYKWKSISGFGTAAGPARRPKRTEVCGDAEDKRFPWPNLGTRKHLRI
jgi:hypothetical protein